MSRSLLSLVLFLFSSVISFAQKKVQWTADLVIDEQSFQDTPPNLAEDQVQEMSFQTTYDFAYQMTNAQFMFTKNFNKYVEAYYLPTMSWIEEGDEKLTSELLLLANLQFDMSELFARKFRKELYERKKLGSAANFYDLAHAEVSNEYSKLNAEINSQLRISNDWSSTISDYSKKINSEINELYEYCKTCKPVKKKKRK